jgi:hypothetical protein
MLMLCDIDPKHLSVLRGIWALPVSEDAFLACFYPEEDATVSTLPRS